MTLSSAAVLPELPAMSFCFKPCLKRKPRGIGLLFLLDRPLILLMEMNSEIRRSIIPAASQSVRRLEAVYLESIASSPFISVCAPSSAFARMGQESISHQSSKDSFGYYATCVPCQRCARRHRRWLQAPLTSPWHFRFRFFLPWRVDRLARKNSITSLMRCCSGSLSSPSRGSVACVSRVLDSKVWQAHLPRRISGAVGLRANHGKRPFARKSHSWILAIGFRRTSPVDMAPAMKASGAKRP